MTDNKKLIKMSKKEYESIVLKQKGVCKICERKPENKKKLAIDYDESTGKMRGLLCRACKGGLEQFQDSVHNLTNAIKYLNIPTERPFAAAIDLDDVTVGFMEELINFHKNLTGKYYPKSYFKEWKLPDDLRTTFLKYESLIYSRVKVKRGAREGIQKLKDAGYKIVFITARSPKFRQETEGNLANLKIKYDELFFLKNKALKLNRLQELYNVRMFIDDKADTVDQVRRETKIENIYLMNMSSNKTAKLEAGIKRINSLDDIKIKE